MPTGPFLRDEIALADHLRAGGKPPEAWAAGVEYEQIGLRGPDFLPLPYSGPVSVAAVLRGLTQAAGWSPVEEDGHVIALARGGARVSLEPGGQVELSGSVHRSLGDLGAELARFHGEIRSVSDPLGIHWLAIGLQPFAPLREVPWMPKRRYRILGEHLAARGTLAHDMMKRTAGVQVNLDFGDEADAMEKFRVAMGLTSVVTGVFANSPIAEGRPNGFRSLRAHIWMHTDADRCGLLRFAFEPDLAFARYVEYALRVPSLFLVRDGRWHATGGVPFGSLLRTGWNGEPLRMEDWALHLTSLFPEVRIKQYLEIRGADGATVPQAVALAALWIGILYDPESRRRAWDLVARLTFEERLALHADVCRRGLDARVGSRTARAVASDLLVLAREGLARRAEAGSDDAARIEPLEAMIREGPPADEILRRWRQEGWADRRADLVAYCTQETRIGSA